MKFRSSLTPDQCLMFLKWAAVAHHCGKYHDFHGDPKPNGEMLFTLCDALGCRCHFEMIVRDRPERVNTVGDMLIMMYDALWDPSANLSFRPNGMEIATADRTIQVLG